MSGLQWRLLEDGTVANSPLGMEAEVLAWASRPGLHPASLVLGLTQLPDRGLLGRKRGGCRALPAPPLSRLCHTSRRAFVLGRNDQSIKVSCGWFPTAPPAHIHVCPACQFTDFSPMFTQEPPQNPGTATRILLSHFTDKEIDSG